MDGCCSSLDEYADTVTLYISFCEDVCLPKKSIVRYNSGKLWLIKELRVFRLAKDHACKIGNKEECRIAKQQFNQAMNVSKDAYKKRLERGLSNTNSWAIWSSLQEMTSIAQKRHQATLSPTLVNQLIVGLTNNHHFSPLTWLIPTNDSSSNPVLLLEHTTHPQASPSPVFSVETEDACRLFLGKQ